MDARDCPIMIEPLDAESGGGFIALVPDLPGCMPDGETPADALANAIDAIWASIDTAKVHGRAVPSPIRAKRYA